MGTGSRTFLSAMTLLLASGVSASAATISIETNTDDQYVTKFGLSDRTTVQGIDFVGANVTINYEDGTIANLIWQATSKFGGGISNAFTTMNAINGPYVIDTTKRIGSILFDTIGSDTLYDIVYQSGDAVSSFGSGVGSPFHISAGDPGDGEIKVTYSGAVTISGYEQRPDLFTRMLVDFSGLSGGGFLGHLEYGSDLDNLRVAGDLTLVSDVPLPAGMPLLFAGLAGFGLMRRRRR